MYVTTVTRGRAATADRIAAHASDGDAAIMNGAIVCALSDAALATQLGDAGHDASGAPALPTPEGRFPGKDSNGMM